AGRVIDVQRLEGVHHLVLGFGIAGTGNQLITLGYQFLALGLHGVQTGLQLVHDLTLGGDGRFQVLGALFSIHLALDGHGGQLVELLLVGCIAGSRVLIGLVGRGQGLAAPLLYFLLELGVVILGHAQVADGLGNRLLGLGNVVGVFANRLVQHLLRILQSIQSGVGVSLADTEHSSPN